MGNSLPRPGTIQKGVARNSWGRGVRAWLPEWQTVSCIEAFSDMLGTRRWNHTYSPCPWCTTDLAHMHDYSCNKPFLDCAAWTQAKVDTQITVVSPTLVAEISAALAPDFSKNGSNGLALKHAVGPTLRAGDRLDEIDGGRDIYSDLTALPHGTGMHFFRPRKENRLMFWCPLLYDKQFQPEPVLTPTNLVHDTLHTLDGGVAQYAGGSIFRFFLPIAA